MSMMFLVVCDGQHDLDEKGVKEFISQNQNKNFNIVECPDVDAIVLTPEEFLQKYK